MVGGGKIYSQMKGNVKMTCEDGSFMYLQDVHYVPLLGINLMSSRQVCCHGGMKGALDESHMYFRKNNRTVITATMRNGLYIVSHIDNNDHDLAYNSTNLDQSTNEMIVDEEVVEDNELTSKEKERYIQYHRQFAHLGPQKLRNLHLVTNLSHPIKVPSSRE